MNNKFKEIGNYLIQTGLYLCTKEDDKFDEDNQIHTNIINFLMQSYLFLKTYNDRQQIEANTDEEKRQTKEEIYLSRKELLGIYHPLFTEYSLAQAIHTKKIPYIKRGSKYFFKKSEVDTWLNEKNCDSSNKTFKFV